LATDEFAMKANISKVVTKEELRKGGNRASE